MARLRETMNDQAPEPGQGSNDKRKRKRITVYCHEDGSPDLDSVPEEQRRALGLGGSTDQAEPEPVQTSFEPAMIGMFLPVLVGIESALVAPRMGINQDQARSALTPAPPLADAIAQAATKVLNKYGSALGRWADEIALVSIVATWQVMAFSEMQRIRAASAPAPQAPPPPPDVHETIEAKPKKPSQRPDPIPFPGAPIEDEPLL